jgi:hypothetical protein
MTACFLAVFKRFVTTVRVLLFASSTLVLVAGVQAEELASGDSFEDLGGYQESRQPCLNRNSQRQVFFGDTHVHTKYSLDASTQGTRTSPADAYRFARGAEIGVQPWTAEGKAMRRLRLERPLDFAVVTDHAELFGEVEMCQTPKFEAYNSWQCKVYRNLPRAAFFLFNTQSSRAKRLGMCGEDGGNCRDAGLRPWQEIQHAAEAAYDRSADCEFTSFVAYEWTGASANLANLHRNILFKNKQVPDLPLSFIDTPSAPLLWDALDRDCVNAGTGCEVLVIPHNSNLSDGYMFSLARDDGSSITADDARQRARLERLVELMQHKGSSECFYDPLNSADELCGFEQLPYGTFADKFVGKILPFMSEPAKSDAGFIRDVLRDGMAQKQRLGVNPFKLGFIASSDTHIGAPGAVAEHDFLGHGGAGVPVGDEVPEGLPDDLEFNPGGLAAVWAEENSRTSLFEGMQRRETYGTSGPRISLRFFGGDEALPDDICERSDYVALGYERGVAMGGDLSLADMSASPVFTAFAKMDAGRSGRPGMLLQRIQIIKGSVDNNGQRDEKVIDIAGDSASDAGVNLQTCATFGRGYTQLCGRWKDPQFDPAEHAYYYARVVENPSCRWSQQICIAAKVDCDNASTIKPGYEQCCVAAHRPIIQERAWSSPIWFSPNTDIGQRPVAVSSQDYNAVEGLLP